jgi:hypothetical protein
VFVGLKCLQYYSHATDGVAGPRVRELAEDAARVNHRLGVTGWLIHENGLFLQLIEGEREVIDNLFARIERDPRHRNVEKTLDRDIDNRAFPTWSMRLVAVDGRLEVSKAAVDASGLSARSGPAGLENSSLGSILADDTGGMFARFVRVRPMQPRAVETMAKLLDAIRVQLMAGRMPEAQTLGGLAREASVTPQNAYRYFPEISGAIRVFVAYRQALMIRAILAEQRLIPPNASLEEQAEKLVTLVIAAQDIWFRLPRRVRHVVLEEYHEIPFRKLWARIEATKAGYGPDVEALARIESLNIYAATLTLAAVTKGIVLSAPECLHGPATKRMLIDICLAALRSDADPPRQEVTQSQ